MKGDRISYREGYKYVLAETYAVLTNIRPTSAIKIEYLELNKAGVLTIRKGYAWDGASWAIDTLNFMRGSLVHDALYQLIREQLLPQSCRKAADQLLRYICREDGMSAVRAWWVYQGVRFGGGPSADPANRNPVIQAP